MSTKQILSIICLCAVITGCNADDSDEATYIKDGIIRYVPPPDSCDDYMIVFEIDQFEKYFKPDNLSDDFKVDGLRVRVTCRITEEKHNCGFGGYVPIIHIIKIKKI